MLCVQRCNSRMGEAKGRERDLVNLQETLTNQVGHIVMGGEVHGVEIHSGTS